VQQRGDASVLQQAALALQGGREVRLDASLDRRRPATLRMLEQRREQPRHLLAPGGLAQQRAVPALGARLREQPVERIGVIVRAQREQAQSMGASCAERDPAQKWGSRRPNSRGWFKLRPWIRPWWTCAPTP
jgi:hypothetical protein